MLRRSGIARALVEASIATHGEASIATLTLNHPSSRNALTVAVGDEMVAAVDHLRSIKSLRAVVVTGAGDRAFSAGGDMDFLRARTVDTFSGNVKEMRAFYARFLSVRSLEVPVVAAVNGHAIGAGLCFALACDFRLLADSARLGVNFVKLGIHPGMAATYNLPRLIGHAHASRLLLTGDEFSAAQAMAMGLAVGTAPSSAEVKEQAHTFALKLATTTSHVAMKETIATLRGSEDTLNAALQREAEAQAACYGHAGGRDLIEAIDAMKEKRSPKF